MIFWKIANAVYNIFLAVMFLVFFVTKDTHSMCFFGIMLSCSLITDLKSELHR